MHVTTAIPRDRAIAATPGDGEGRIGSDVTLVTMT